MYAVGQIRASLVWLPSLSTLLCVITPTTDHWHRAPQLLVTRRRLLAEPCRYLRTPPTLTAALHVTRFSLSQQQQQHLFSRLFSRTTWIGRYQKDKPFCILLKQEMAGWLWHRLNHMQVICTSLQIDNHASTSSLMLFTCRLLFLLSN